MIQFRSVLISLLGLVAFSCNNESPTQDFVRNPTEIIFEDDIIVESYDFESFKPFTKREDDKVHVINFWATWCIPCVQELPYFEELKEKYPTIELTFVSLDFPSKIKESLIPFLKKNTLLGDVILLDEPNGNNWIPQIDPNWSGAIPATLIYKNKKSQFYEQSFNFEELEKAVKAFL